MTPLVERILTQHNSVILEVSDVINKRISRIFSKASRDGVVDMLGVNSPQRHTMSIISGVRG